MENSTQDYYTLYAQEIILMIIHISIQHLPNSKKIGT